MDVHDRVGGGLPTRSVSLTSEALLDGHAHARNDHAHDPHGVYANRDLHGADQYSEVTHDECDGDHHNHGFREVLEIDSSAQKCDLLHDGDHCDSRDVSAHDHHRLGVACGGALMDDQGDGPHEAEGCSDAHKRPFLLHPYSAIAKGNAHDDSPHHGPFRVQRAHDESHQDDVTINGFLDVKEALQNGHGRSMCHGSRDYDHSGVVWLSTVQGLL
jgi:hypothetical protein